MLKQLRIKFICFTMVLAFLLLCVISGTVYAFTARNLEADSLQMMRSISVPHNRPNSKDTVIRVPYLILQQNKQGIWVAHGNDYYDLEDQAFLTELLQTVSAEEKQSGNRFSLLLPLSHRELPEKQTELPNK